MRPLLLTATSCIPKKKKILLQILQTSLIGLVFGTADLIRLICLISHKQLQVSSHTDPGIANLIKTTGKS